VKASTHVFATDLLDEGIGRALDTIRQVGLDAVTYAGIYHHARDILPRNPRRKVVFHEGGVAYFRPDPDRYRNARLQPRMSSLVDAVDPLEEAVREADRRGLTVRVWTNNMHNTALGSSHPDCAVRNVFGDPYITSLCPANPDVRAYVRNVTADIVRYGVPTVILESVGFMPFAHGYHHERSHYPISPTVGFLLSLCFCEHCTATAMAAGVAVEQLQRHLADELAPALDGEPAAIDSMPLTRSDLAQLFDGELEGFLVARHASVTSLVADVVDAARSVGSAEIVFMEWSGGIIGYESGEIPAGGAISRAWQDGTDIAAIAEVSDGLAILGYTRDTGRLETDLAAYRAAAGDKALSIALRPMPPDSRSFDELERKVHAAAAVADWVEFYHYGLMRQEGLEWVERVLTRVDHSA
jgi:hypothetical protein